MTSLRFSCVADGVYQSFLLDSPTAQGYSSWANSSDPDAPEIFMDFYVYNITNLPAMLAGETPLIEEVSAHVLAAVCWMIIAAIGFRVRVQVGPFTFKENQMMLNTSWSQGGDVIKCACCCGLAVIAVAQFPALLCIGSRCGTTTRRLGP